MHFHPHFQISLHEEYIQADSTAVAVKIVPFGTEMWTLALGEKEPCQGWHFPEFGLALPAPAITLRVASNTGAWWGYRLHIVRSP